MTTLLELKEKMVRFYSRNEVFITPVIRFLIAFALFLTINGSIGYMKVISRTPVALILALVCSVFPTACTIFLASAVILADMYALSLEVCAVTLVLLILVYFMYFRFAPKNGYDVLLTPLCFQLRIPYVMPLGMGLVRELYSAFALVCGTVVYFFLDGVRKNAAVLSSAAEEEDGSVSRIVAVLNQLVGNKEMYLVLGVLLATMVIVYLIRRMSIEYAWTVAIISGIVFETVGLMAGYLLLGIAGKTLEVLLGGGIACLIAFLLQFVFFNLDYSRTERLQFEDDEYYYYVKAVPKAFVPGTEKKIKRFSGGDEERLSKKQLMEEMDLEEEWLD